MESSFTYGDAYNNSGEKGNTLEDSIDFDFEEAISREEEERKRLLESQGALRSSSSTSSSTALSKGRNIVCRHWIRGMCWKGDFCEFLHQYDTGKMPLCRQFQKNGYCVDNERGCCMFLHNKGAEDGPVCIHYFLGFCRAGPKCRKRHQRLDVENIPPLVPDWYLHLILSNARTVIPEGSDPEADSVLAEVEKTCRELSGSGVIASSPSQKNVGSKQVIFPGGKNLRMPSQHSNSQSDVASINYSDGSGKIDGNYNDSRSLNRGSYRNSSSSIDSSLLRLAQEKGIPRVALGGVTSGTSKTQIFMIKSSELGNIHKSIRLGVWATGKQNTRVLEQAFNTNDNVILLFSANESGGFQGYGRMVSGTIQGLYPNLWGSFSIRLGNNFRVQWLKQCKVDFEKFGGLTNPLNDNQSIRKSRDCQEIPFSVAAIICTVLDQEPDEDTLHGTQYADNPRIDHSTFFNLTESEKLKKEAELGLRESPVLPTVIEPSLSDTHSRKTSVQLIPRKPPPPPSNYIVNEEQPQMDTNLAMRPYDPLMHQQRLQLGRTRPYPSDHHSYSSLQGNFAPLLNRPPMHSSAYERFLHNPQQHKKP